MSNDTVANEADKPSKPQPAARTKPTKETSVSKKAAKKTYTLGDFELIKVLGQGGMGKVYLGQQISLDRPCAVKVMSKELTQKPDFVERFKREARAMAKIDHPNVVRCFAVGEQRGKHYVAMELIDGKSMQDWLDDVGHLSVADAVLVTLICADALQYAHHKNMVHRDIKPDNLLVTKDGIVKVADLGLAKATDEDMSMTQSGTGLGTPHYMPPEQARDAKHADARCDIYALGVTLYHFVTGKLPFCGDSVLELITAKEKGLFKPASRLKKNVPERLDLIIDKMMAKDPQHRYSSCAEFIADLEALGVAGESLSFIGETEGGGTAIPARRSGSPGTMRMGGATASMDAPANRRPASVAQQRSSGERTARRKSSAERDALKGSGSQANAWYVRYTDKSGRIKVSKMSTQQILMGMKSDALDLKTRISRDKQEAFIPLAQVPVFEDEANRMVTRVQASRKKESLADAYEKIGRQYDRQKWWRLLSRFKDGTLGFVGLILWLLLVFAVAGGAIYGLIQSWDSLGGWLEGLSNG